MPDDPDKKNDSLKSVAAAESLAQLAVALPAACLIGWFAGSWLDRHFHQDWIGVAGIVLGAAAGILQIFRTASRYLRKNQ
jgi:ATP synthase protein I